MRGTIRSSREIDAIFREGERAATRALVLLAGKTPAKRGPRGRVAFVAGKKLSNAVVRNRAKRVMRAAVHRSGGPWAGWDIVLIARSAAIDCPATELDRLLDSALRKAGAISQ